MFLFEFPYVTLKKKTKSKIFFFFICISKLRREGIPQWLYEEAKTLSEISFRFRSKQDPVDYVESLTESMHSHPGFVKTPTTPRNGFLFFIFSRFFWQKNWIKKKKSWAFPHWLRGLSRVWWRMYKFCFAQTGKKNLLP